jgi:LacI family repressor for deo operon, udp, cdd, tsx, nupC, and nupG
LFAAGPKVSGNHTEHQNDATQHKYAFLHIFSFKDEILQKIIIFFCKIIIAWNHNFVKSFFKKIFEKYLINFMKNFSFYDILWGENMSSTKTTYQKLAAVTGISIATISRVITGAPGVKEETRQKVVQLLDHYGYDISQIRLRDAALKSGLLVFNIPSFGNPFYGQILSGAKMAATQRGWQLLINEEHINDSTIGSFLTFLKKVNAVGLITANHVSPPLLKKLNEEIPLVQCCEYDSSFDIPFVSIDDVAAAKTSMEYLFSLGRKNIAFINGPIRYKYARQRLQGYREALEEAGIPSSDDMVLQLPDISYDLAVSAVTNLLNEGKRPDAFFCASDVFAAAVISAASRAGLSVPQDIMAMGFDNVDISFMTSPTITTINQPKFQLGFSSCEFLVERVTNPQSPLHNILLATELIARESTAVLQQRAKPVTLTEDVFV